MSEEKDFDEILRSKFEEQLFPFDEENWDEAEEMIERQRRKEKRRRRFILFFIGIMTGIGMVLPFFYSLNNSISENKVQSKNKTQNIAENKNDSFNEINKKDSIENKQENQTADNKNTDSTNDYYDEQESDKLKSNTENKNLEKTNKGKQENQKVKAGKNDISNASQQKSELIPNKSQKNKNTDKPIKNESSNPKEVITPSNNMVNKVDKSSDKLDTNSIVKNENLTIIHDESIIVQKIDSSAITKTDSTIKTTDTLLTAMDTVLSNTPTKEPKTEFTPVRTWNLWVGSAYHKGWKYNDTLDGNGFSPVMGIQYQSHFKTHSSFSLGILYQFSGNLSYSYKNSISHQPSFGLNDSINRYSVKRNHYLIAPIMYYFVKNKNQFGLGASFSYLILSNSKITIMRQSYSDLETLSVEKGKNFMEGFNRMDISLNLSYRRKLNSKFDFVTDFNFGLLDQKENSYFTNAITYFERNIYLRAGFNFKIFTQ